jgi:hypothetical protein
VLKQDSINDTSPKLKSKELINYFFLFFLSDEWGMKGCEKKGMMMMIVRRGKKSWHIMRK